MPAGAPYGNRNAEKWTFKKAVKLYHEALKLASEKETITITKGTESRTLTGYKYDFIGEIASELGTFHMLITSHLPKRFPVLERLKNQLIARLEANCYYNTKKGIIREATGIVNLKSNHKWTDRTENTHNVDEQLKEYLKPFSEVNRGNE